MPEPFNPTYPPPRAKLDANESPYEIPADLKERVFHRALGARFSRYESSLENELTEAVADYARVSPDMIVLGNGSDEILHLLAFAYSGPDRPVVAFRPSFETYGAAAELSHAPYTQVELRPPDFPLDMAALTEAVSRGDAVSRGGAANGKEAGLVYLCRPNNPTANLCEVDEVRSLVRGTRAMVAVDEAYFEFAGSTVVPLVDRLAPNLCVSRTFSKAFRLAGLRLGYLVAPPEAVEKVRAHKMPYNLNHMTVAAGLVMLEEVGRLKGWVAETLKERERLEAGLASLAPAVRPLPSTTNFILFELPGRDHNKVWETLRLRGIYIRRYRGETLLDGYLRVSVGSPTENDLFLEELRAVLQA